MTTIRFYNYEEKNSLFTNPTLTQIGKKYGKTAAQVALRWLLQSDVIIIPKTVHKERMEENLNLFDFKLDAEDISQLLNLTPPIASFSTIIAEKRPSSFMEWRVVVKPTE